jgi:hypothetical protein
MMSERDEVRSIAERVARRLSESREQVEKRERIGADNLEANDLAALQANLIEIKRRLAHIESHIKHDESCDADNEDRSRENTSYGAIQERSAKGNNGAPKFTTGAPSLSGTYYSVVHPSEERFQIGEAVAELVDYFENEKTCDLEPGGKPCDHCAMCSSRGL